MVEAFGPTALAAHHPDRTVEFQDPGAAGGLVVSVHVLRDDRHLTGRFQIGDRLMGGVGSRRGDEAAAPVVPAPDEFGVAGESLGGGQVFGPVPAPQAVLLAAEGRDAAGRGYPGPGKYGDPDPRRDVLPDLFQFLANMSVHRATALIHRTCCRMPILTG